MTSEARIDKAHLRSLAWNLLLLIIASAITAWACAAELDGRGTGLAAVVCNWEELEDRITSEIDLTGRAIFGNSATITELREGDNILLWFAMTDQADRPLVAIAGWHCVSQQRPELAVEAGLNTIACARNPGLALYAPVYDFLQHNAWEEDDYRHVARLAQRKLVPRENLAALFGVLPIELLRRFVAEDVAPDATNVEFWAMAASTVCSEDDSDEVVRAQLSRMRHIPGLPRLVYAMHSELDIEGDRALLICVLKDESLTDMEFTALVWTRYDEIRDVVRSVLDDLPERRRVIVADIESKKR